MTPWGQREDWRIDCSFSVLWVASRGCSQLAPAICRIKFVCQKATEPRAVSLQLTTWLCWIPFERIMQALDVISHTLSNMCYSQVPAGNVEENFKGKSSRGYETVWVLWGLSQGACGRPSKWGQVALCGICNSSLLLFLIIPLSLSIPSTWPRKYEGKQWKWEL